MSADGDVWEPVVLVSRQSCVGAERALREARGAAVLQTLPHASHPCRVPLFPGDASEVAGLLSA